ncbi:polysaccharide ABC transporter ATP-binding protein [Methylomonas methanica]|uniref:ABC transporter domain-containing protein n=1 Tax=Methylomonas methanica TaxID=421 RepID=A0A177MPM1_METMH|nr:ABC transporter ATP-binding protein [Methylomonas methanica]OAI07542.1 hypothetical protein A1332_08645 [Methylomonas methanica]
MSTAIKVENLGKKYIIQHQQQSRYQYNSLGESLSRGIKSLGKNLLHPFHSNTKAESAEEFWALKDINFEIKQGDRVGIIGRNGAGKSTLLKILSRITHPSTGRITINGRVSSLLEVGTGFHPELTGRENIFLNGAILGMHKKEIQRKFDEIVDFAEVEKFLDTPVKHYSSGMYVRLAFAVAAHLEPEILIVDEVLAVGDFEFQKKCLGRMEKAGNEGKTVLFVSHNIASIRKLCRVGVLLIDGQINLFSDIEQVISKYLTTSTPVNPCYKSKEEFRMITKQYFVNDASVLNSSENLCGTFHIGETINFKFRIKRGLLKKTMGGIKAALEIRSNDGLKIANIISSDCSFQIDSFDDQIGLLINIEDIRLYPGEYILSIWVGTLDSHETYDYANECIRFEIVSGGKLTTRNLPRNDGLFFFTPKWSTV